MRLCVVLRAMTDTRSALASPRLPRRRTAAGFAILLATLAAACSAGPAASQPPGSAGPTVGPTAAPTIAGIEHPTGARDIVLRVEASGGFAPIEWLATSAPSFTLYGDGTVVWRDEQSPMPEPVGNVMRAIPFKTVHLEESQIQALLEEALGRGGLGAAVGPYVGMGADIPTTTFTVNAGSTGKAKQVSVTGLSPDMHPQNALIVDALARFAERLRAFGSSVSGQPYIPAAYRGILIPVDQPFGPVVDWPWTDITPDQFSMGENEFFLTRTMTPADVSTLGIQGAEGGLQGFTLQKGGKIYTFALRPLLPDETS